MELKNDDLVFKLPKMSKLQRYLVGKEGFKNTRFLLSYLDSFSNNKLQKYEARNFVVPAKLHLVPFQREDKLAKKSTNEVYYKALRSYNPSEQHYPNENDKGKWIGVEIECLIPNWRLAELYITSDNHGVLSRWLISKKIKGLSLKHDGSISCDEEEYTAAEFTLVFNRNDRTPLIKLCAVLKELKAQVNKSCGLHVHLDQRDLMASNGIQFNRFELLKRARNIGRCLPFLAQLIPYSRRNNTYCELRVGKLKGSRYNAVNLTAFKKYKTIEIRMHSSTIEFEKINNWIDLLLIIMYNKNIKPVNNLSDLCESFNIPEKLITFYETRIEKFKENATQETDNNDQIVLQATGTDQIPF